MSAPAPKFTARCRRAIPLLFAYLAEDIDHPIESRQHPMNRRLRGSAYDDMQALIRWLAYQVPPPPPPPDPEQQEITWTPPSPPTTNPSS